MRNSGSGNLLRQPQGGHDAEPTDSRLLHDGTVGGDRFADRKWLSTDRARR